MLERFKVTVVVRGDGLRHIAAFHGSHNTAHVVDRADDVVQCFVHAFHDFAEIALVRHGIGTGIQTACHGRFRQHACIGHQLVHGLDTGVQVVLQRVEVAVVRVGDLGRNIAARDVVHILGGHVQRANHRIQRVVHALHDLLVFAMVLRGVGTGGQLALHGRLGQPGGFAAHGLDGAHRFVQRQQHLPHFIAGRGVNLHIEVARSNFFGNLHGLTHGAGDGARDPPTQQHGQQYRHARQAQQQGLRRRNDRSRVFARLFHQLGLVAHQLGNGAEVSGLLLAQVAR